MAVKVKALVTVTGADYEPFGYDVDATLPPGATAADVVPDVLKLLSVSCARRSDPKWVMREIAYMHGEAFGKEIDALLDSKKPQTEAGALIGDVFQLERTGS